MKIVSIGHSVPKNEDVCHGDNFCHRPSERALKKKCKN